MSLTASQATTIVNALRDGTAPDEGIELLTVGRDRWLASLVDDLNHCRSGNSRIRVFNGRYGDGKTHLMKALRLCALRIGYVVSFVSISKDVPLNRWDLLYKELVQRLHTASRPDEVGLTTILNPHSPDPAIANEFKALSEAIRRNFVLHSDFATAIYRFTTRQGASIDPEQDLLTLRNWLEGQRIAARILQPLGISASIDKHNSSTMLKTLADCLRYYGFSGLVLLVDEVESTLEQSTTVRKQAYENLRLLIDREKLPKCCQVVLSTTPEMFTDEQKGFQSYPALWRRVKELGISEQINYNATVVDLSRTPLTVDDLFGLAKRIRDIHGKANSWVPINRVTDQYLLGASKLAASGSLTLVFAATAVFVKLICEECDLSQQSDNYNPSVEKLGQRFLETDRALRGHISKDSWPTVE